MEKSSQAGVVISKAGENGSDKIVFRLTKENILKTVLCFVTQFSGVFASMSPFGMAFYVSVFRQDSWIVGFLASIIAMALSEKSYFWTYAVSLAGITCIMAMSDKVCKSPLLRATWSGVLFVICGAAKYLRGGIIIFDILALTLEGLLTGVGVIVFYYGYAVFVNLNKRSFISEKENIYAYASLAIVLLSLRGFGGDLPLDISSVISTVIIYILCMSNTPNAALIPAILLGITGAMNLDGNSATIGTFAFGAMLGTSLRSYGKTGVVLGFVIANTAASLFLSDAEQIVLSIYDSLAAAIIFAFVPKKIFRFFSQLSEKTSSSSKKQSALPFGRACADDFRRMAGALGNLAEIYSGSDRRCEIANGYIKNSLNDVKNKICIGCPSKEKCYGENGYVYEVVRNYISAPSLKVNPSTLTNSLSEICHHKDGFTEEIKPVIHILRNESQWISKTNESKKLISRQLAAISDALGKTLKKSGLVREGHLEEKIYIELDKTKISPRSVVAESGTDDEFEIRICIGEESVDKTTSKECRKCIENAMGCSVDFGGAKREDGYVTFAYYQSCGYSASFGYASRAKNGEKISGDSFDVVYTDRSKMVMVLSDGMGSGSDAAKESGTVVRMLKSFLHAGVECNTAINLINSSLLLKGNKESFATLDICEINLNDASAAFTKLGAAGAYIKTENKIRKISGKSLPAGIVREANGEKVMLPIVSDCTIVLVSDGVADAGIKNNGDDKWLEKELSDINNRNPQIVAAKILESALKHNNKRADDDMTVITACITKKV